MIAPHARIPHTERPPHILAVSRSRTLHAHPSNAHWPRRQAIPVHLAPRRRGIDHGIDHGINTRINRRIDRRSVCRYVNRRVRRDETILGGIDRHTSLKRFSIHDSRSRIYEFVAAGGATAYANVTLRFAAPARTTLEIGVALDNLRLGWQAADKHTGYKQKEAHD